MILVLTLDLKFIQLYTEHVCYFLIQQITNNKITFPDDWRSSMIVFFLFGCILEIERLKMQENLFYSSQLWMSMFFCLISIYILQSKDSNLLAQYVYIFFDSVYLHFSTRSKPFWIENLSLILTTKMKTTWKFIDFHTQISIHTSGQDEKGIFIYLHARLFNWYNSFGAFTL